jgi:hypothetical protein
MSIYRAVHTAIWCDEISEDKITELFPGNNSTSKPILTPLSVDMKRSLLATFQSTNKDLSSLESSFWTNSINETNNNTLLNQTSANISKELKSTISKLSEKGRDMVGSALFILGEIYMVGFSVEEDEGVASSTGIDLFIYMYIYIYIYIYVNAYI